MSIDANAVVLERYNAKVFKNRKEHMLKVNPAEDQMIIANTRAIPGIMTNRGCCYAGCKGVVLGPIKDMVLITHGPVGCGFYSWGTRRNKAKAEGDTPNYIQYCFSTDMQEPDIVFGGTKKLKKAIDEIMELMHPKTIMIAATCPVGLIGDDIQAVAAEAEKEYGIRCVAYSCEGYKGVSQSAGHHIANNGLMKRVNRHRQLRARHQVFRQHPWRIQHRRRRLGAGAHPEKNRLRSGFGFHRRRRSGNA